MRRTGQSTSRCLAVTVLLVVLSSVFGFCCVPLWSIARAATLRVPVDYTSIQAAIEAAAAGDEIVVAPGTYSERIDFHGKAIALRSSGGAEVTTVDGSGSVGSVVQCVSGEGPDTILEGFTITGGNSLEGGGMINIGTSPTVIGCVFTKNRAGDRGGGMYNRGAAPTIIDTLFEDNESVYMGGGLFNTQSSPIISDSVFDRNRSSKGGGMRNYIDSHPTIIRSIFSYNVAVEEGGGLDNRKNSNPIVSACRFIGNSAGSGGGGMHNYVGKAITIGNPTITNSLFVGNAAPEGAGIRNNDQHPTIINTNVIFNHGSGISNRQGSRPTIVNSIIWGNTGGSLSGSTAALSIVSYSDVEGGFAGPGNLDVAPLFASPGGPDGDPDTLDDNRYQLALDSPLIDVGDSEVPGLSELDLDGSPRISGRAVDIGAYELVAAAPVPLFSRSVTALLIAVIAGLAILGARTRASGQFASCRAK